MKKKNKTLLWSIEAIPSDSEATASSEPSYVFGTMHVRDQRAFGFLEKVYAKIDACQSFATEFNLEEMNRQVTADTMDLPEGQSLPDLLSPKQYQKVDKVFQKVTGLPLDAFAHSRPFMITSLISEAVLSKDMPFSLDESLWRYAKEKEKVLLGLETYQQQIEIIKNLPIETQVKSLVSLARNFKKFRKQLLEMTESYAEADLQKLYQEARKNARGMRKILLYNRNVVMAEKIRDIMQEQSLCAAIGAGHLGGKRGVLRLLKGMGYRVKPVALD